jgi:hypothetical protein
MVKARLASLTSLPVVLSFARSTVPSEGQSVWIIGSTGGAEAIRLINAAVFTRRSSRGNDLIDLSGAVDFDTPYVRRLGPARRGEGHLFAEKRRHIRITDV